MNFNCSFLGSISRNDLQSFGNSRCGYRRHCFYICTADLCHWALTCWPETPGRLRPAPRAAPPERWSVIEPLPSARLVAPRVRLYHKRGPPLPQEPQVTGDRAGKAARSSRPPPARTDGETEAELPQDADPPIASPCVPLRPPRLLPPLHLGRARPGPASS